MDHSNLSTSNTQSNYFFFPNYESHFSASNPTNLKSDFIRPFQPTQHDHGTTLPLPSLPQREDKRKLETEKILRCLSEATGCTLGPPENNNNLPTPSSSPSSTSLSSNLRSNLLRSCIVDYIKKICRT